MFCISENSPRFWNPSVFIMSREHSCTKNVSLTKLWFQLWVSSEKHTQIRLAVWMWIHIVANLQLAVGNKWPKFGGHSARIWYPDRFISLWVLAPHYSWLTEFSITLEIPPLLFLAHQGFWIRYVGLKEPWWGGDCATMRRWFVQKQRGFAL